MDEAGTLPNNAPPRRWSVGADSPAADALEVLPPAVAARLEECASGPAGELPPDYGDPNGLWVTVRGRNPFEVLLLDPASPLSAETLLVRFRVLWKFWTQKAAIARQGATRAVIRQKYGDNIESYIDNLQWAYDQLSSDQGMAFWRKRVHEQRARLLWARVADIIDATLADGVLDVPETKHLFSRAASAGYEPEEFAGALRHVLYTRKFESESAPSGSSDAERLASVRWATPEMWARMRAATNPPAPQFYLRVRHQGVLGPMPAAQVEELIRARRVNAGDAICIVGASAWQPIEQSQYAHHFRAPMPECRRCGHVMMLVMQSAAGGWVVLVFGLITSFFIVGIPLVIAGIVMIANAHRRRWQCTHCSYLS